MLIYQEAEVTVHTFEVLLEKPMKLLKQGIKWIYNISKKNASPDLTNVMNIRAHLQGIAC